MCYKVATPDPAKLRAHVKNIEVRDYEMYYHANGFSKPWLPLQLNTEPNVIQPAQWGLIPLWTKTQAAHRSNTLNAVGEDIRTTPSYRQYVDRYRGLLWVDGFFESQHRSAKDKQPYYIYYKTKEPFTMGCVWTPWQDQETGDKINTFSVVTAPANELLREIHNSAMRMPLIIQEQDREKWLSDISREEVEGLMRSLPDGILEAHTVSKLVNQPKVDTNIPEVQTAIVCEQPGSLF